MTASTIFFDAWAVRPIVGEAWHTYAPKCEPQEESQRDSAAFRKLCLGVVPSRAFDQKAGVIILVPSHILSAPESRQYAAQTKREEVGEVMLTGASACNPRMPAPREHFDRFT